MATPQVTLRRLLPPADAERFLSAFGGLLPGQAAAVLDVHGSPLAWRGGPSMDDWTARVWAALKNRPSGEPDGQPVCLESAAAYPLTVDQQNLGWLMLEESSAKDSSAVGAAMQTALALLLTERLEKRRLARETLDRYREVNLLYHLADRFGGILDAGETLQIALAEARRVIWASSGVVWLTGASVQPGRNAAYLVLSQSR